MYCEPNNFQTIVDAIGTHKGYCAISYLGKILAINEHINLTSITDYDEASLLHLEDSISALPEMNAAPAGKYCDLGCGGGFPGVILGLASERETHLVDSRAKKIKVIMDILYPPKDDLIIETTTNDSAEIQSYTTFKGFAERIEDFTAKHRGEYAVVTARALSSLPSLLELATPLLKKGGVFIALKSQIDAEEEEWGMSLLDMLGLSLESKREFTLSNGETKRAIYAFKKTGKCKIKLPRKVSMAQKHPLAAR